MTRVAIVTGGARGIGRAIAEALRADGLSVVIADPGTDIGGDGADPSVAEAAARDLGAVAWPHPLDDQAAVDALVRRTVADHGGVDVLVNAGAILRDGFVFKLDPADWERVIAVNLTLPFRTTRAVAPVLRDQAKGGRGHGRILNLISTAGLYGNYGQAAYAAAKAGLVGLTRVTALDLQRSGATCNAVAPFAATRVTHSIQPQSPAQEAYKAHALTVPAADVGRLIAWLASVDAAAVTGQILTTRGRELFLMSQVRPAVRLVIDRDRPLGDQLAAAFAGHWTPLDTDLDAFATPPIV
jgi:NAD(P)-dependent dehydrogenase (short-subunit alcohol dehydrogenase family)